MSTRHAGRFAAIALTAVAACVTVGAAHASTRPHQKIAFTSNRSGQQEIVVANAKGRHRVDLTPGRSPQWSPNGGKLAFTSTRDGNSSVYVMDADGANQTRLTVAPVYDSRPHWSGDGKKLVFMRVLDTGNWEIFRMKADGSNPVDLTNNPANEWGPGTRGDQIVFTREENGVGHLFVMNIDGKGQRRVTNTSLYDSYPDFSPDASLVLFLRDTADGNGDDLWIVGADGNGERQLTHQSATGYVLNPTWSPDGSEIMYAQCGPGGASPCALHVMNADGTNDRDISTPVAPFKESFRGDVTDGGLWNVISDPGGTVTTSDRRLIASISGSAVPGGQYDQVDEHIGFQCTLAGDFDYQVGYSLLTWPAAGGFFAQLTAFFADGGMGRTSQVFDPPYNQQYGAFIGGVGGAILTNDTSGTMRLVRTGGTLSAYAKSTSLPRWTLVDAGPAPNPSMMGIGLWAPGNQFQHVDASVAFDHFLLNSGALSCPTWWNDADGSWRP